MEHAEREVRRLETVLYRTLGVLRRLTGSEEISYVIAKMQRAIMIANQLRLAILALQAARMAAGDPVAWALAGVSIAEVGLNVASEFEYRSPSY